MGKWVDKFSQVANGYQSGPWVILSIQQALGAQTCYSGSVNIRWKPNYV